MFWWLTYNILSSPFQVQWSAVWSTSMELVRSSLLVRLSVEWPSWFPLPPRTSTSSWWVPFKIVILSSCGPFTKEQKDTKTLSDHLRSDWRHWIRNDLSASHCGRRLLLREQAVRLRILTFSFFFLIFIDYLYLYSQFFSAIATGISVAGSGVGTIVMPFMSEYFIRSKLLFFHFPFLAWFTGLVDFLWFLFTDINKNTSVTCSVRLGQGRVDDGHSRVRLHSLRSSVSSATSSGARRHPEGRGDGTAQGGALQDGRIRRTPREIY